MKKSETAKQTENLDNNILLVMSAEATLGCPQALHQHGAVADCSTYMTSDGQSCPARHLDERPEKVLSGERAVYHRDSTPRLRRGRSSHWNPSLGEVQRRLVACGQGNGHFYSCCVFI